MVRKRVLSARRSSAAIDLTAPKLVRSSVDCFRFMHSDVVGLRQWCMYDARLRNFYVKTEAAIRCRRRCSCSGCVNHLADKTVTISVLPCTRFFNTVGRSVFQ